MQAKKLKIPERLCKKMFTAKIATANTVTDRLLRHHKKRQQQVMLKKTPIKLALKSMYGLSGKSDSNGFGC